MPDLKKKAYYCIFVQLRAIKIAQKATMHLSR